MVATKITRRLAARSIVGALTSLVGHLSGEASSVESIVYDAASRYGVRGDILWQIALCESGGDPTAVSTRLNINGTSDLGLFQINERTWDWWSGIRGTSGDILSAWDNADMAAWAWSSGYACHWTCAYRIGWCA